MYDKLVAKVKNIDTSEFVLKTKYRTDKAKLEKNSWCNWFFQQQQQKKKPHWIRK